MLLKLYFEVVHLSNLDNTFYDLFCHAYMSPMYNLCYSLEIRYVLSSNTPKKLVIIQLQYMLVKTIFFSILTYFPITNSKKEEKVKK